ncbi:MAG: hypothetical protein V7782_10570 [Psychromonas sp.]
MILQDAKSASYLALYYATQDRLLSDHGSSPLQQSKDYNIQPQRAPRVTEKT